MNRLAALTPPDADVLDNTPRSFVLHLLLETADRQVSIAIDVALAIAAVGAIYYVHTTQEPHPAWAWVCSVVLVAVLVASAGRGLARAARRSRSSLRWWGLMRTVAHPATGTAVVMDTDERPDLDGGPWVLIQPLHTANPSAMWVPVRELTRHDQTETEETS